MAYICEVCVCSPCLCELPPPPTLTRQTNQVERILDLEHDGCENEPCAYCLPAWKDELEALKRRAESIAISIRYHEARILAGEMRAREFAVPLLERQTNEHPLNFQAPRPLCLVRNCQVCMEAGPGIAHLLTQEEQDEYNRNKH